MAEPGTNEGYEAALDLLEIVFRDHQGDRGLGGAYHFQGSCLVATGQIEAGLDCFRRSRAVSYLTFALVVAEKQLTYLYPEALQGIEEFHSEEYLVSEAYERTAALAVFHSHIGQTQLAEEYAREALVACARQDNGHPEFPRWGLVENPHSGLVARLEKIAGEW